MIFSESHGPDFDLIVCGTPGPKDDIVDRFDRVRVVCPETGIVNILPREWAERVKADSGSGAGRG